jgi:uncharacterized repeat protein (TIGR03803 family)
LHSFDGTDGAEPNGLVQGTDGNFYGTTYTGGDIAEPLGTVFKITSSGTFTSLLSFNGAEGGSPTAGLVQGANGNFYSTTSTTFFEITPSGTLTTLHTFNGMDGSGNSARGLVLGADGNFYGITGVGGANGYGTVFKMTPSGALTMLHSFDDLTDGQDPGPALVQDTNGNFYGTAALGGASDHGTIFSLAVGWGPFVETLPTSGTVGAAVMILGTNLTGATAVTFNGTAAVFKMVSASEITTTVPSGATTGEVQVMTPSGTLSSNVSFRVP